MVNSIKKTQCTAIARGKCYTLKKGILVNNKRVTPVSPHAIQRLVSSSKVLSGLISSNIRSLWSFNPSSECSSITSSFFSASILGRYVFQQFLSKTFATVNLTVNTAKYRFVCSFLLLRIISSSEATFKFSTVNEMHKKVLTRERSLSKGRKEDASTELGQRTQEAQTWIEAILGFPLHPRDNLEVSLRNGVALCTLIQKLDPDLMRRFHDEATTNKQRYKAIENM